MAATSNNQRVNSEFLKCSQQIEGTPAGRFRLRNLLLQPEKINGAFAGYLGLAMLNPIESH